MTCRSNFRDLRSSEFEGSSCSILGAGPSLLLADKDFINSMPCFVVNSAIMYTDWHDGNSIDRFWVSNDSLCLRWTYWDKVKTSKCNIVVRDSWCKYSNLLPESAKFFSQMLLPYLCKWERLSRSTIRPPRYLYLCY